MLTYTRNEPTHRHYIGRGMTGKAVRFDKRKPKSKGKIVRKFYERDGITDTLAGWAKRTGVASELLRSRVVNLGWSLEAALTTPKIEPGVYRGGQSRFNGFVQQATSNFSGTPIPTRTYTHDGITDTIKGWSKRTGLSTASLYARLNKGWPLDKMLTTPLMSRAERQLLSRQSIARSSLLATPATPETSSDCPPTA